MNRLKEIMSKADAFLHTDYYLAIVGITVFLSWLLHIEAVGFCLLAVYVIVTLFCCEDALPAFVPILTFVFAMSGFFNPETYSRGVIVLFACLAVLAIGGFIWFFIRNKIRLKLGKQFWFFLAMFIAFLISGLGNPDAVFEKSIPLTIAFGGGAFLAYFFFVNSVTKRDNVYFAKIFFYIALILLFELIICHTVIIPSSSSEPHFKLNINLGWGISNNVGSILLLTIPLTCYLAVKDEKFSIVYIVAVIMQYLAIFLTMSRGSIIFAMAGLPFLFAFTMWKTKKRKEIIIATVITVILAGIVFIIFKDKLLSIVGDTWAYGVSSVGRDKRYAMAIEHFKRFPILGLGVFFTPETGAMFWYHNTFLQFLSSAGIVGAFTYIAYSVNKFRILIIKGDIINKFILFGMVMWTCYSAMMDCGSFLISQVFLVVALLAYAEKNVESEDGKQAGEAQIKTVESKIAVDSNESSEMQDEQPEEVETKQKPEEGTPTES